MLLNFYIQGRPPGSAPVTESDSYLDQAVGWAKTAAVEVSDMDFDDWVDSAKGRAESAFESCKRIFRFLSGDPVPSSQLPPLPSLDVQEEKRESGWMSGVTGLFSGLKGPSRTSGETPPDALHGAVDTEGEVHADLVMVC